ncbi:MAG: hypothetical protein JSU08_03735 [Acidobacteria bacterium]|nr:hypothetical protein [Acidobacteriota bacterium]
MRLFLAATFASVTIAAALPSAQSAAISGSTAPGGRFVAIGCVMKQGAGATARYAVTDTRGDTRTTYRLEGDREQLDRHVGHTVELAGSLTAPGTPKGQYTLKVSGIVWLASNCSKK